MVYTHHFWRSWAVGSISTTLNLGYAPPNQGVRLKAHFFVDKHIYLRDCHFNSIFSHFGDKPLTQNHLGSSSYAQKTIGKGLKPAKPRNFLFENPRVSIHTRVFGHSGMDSCLSECTGMVTMSDHGSDSNNSGSRGKAKSSSSKTSSVLSDPPFKVWFWENKS